MSRRGWMLFLAMGAIWGIPYLLIKVAVEDLSPATLVFARTGIGAALLVPVAVLRGHLRPVFARWRPLLVFTAVEVCLPWFLLGSAEQRLSSSLTGLLVAAVPLVGAVLVVATGVETVSPRRVVGLLGGFAGVAVIVGFDVGGSSLGAVAQVGGVVVLYAVGPLILARYLSDLPGLGVVAASLAIAALVYSPLAAVQWPASTPPADTLWAVAGLGVVCTAVAFLCFFALIAEVGPARATVITYINPAVALTLGVVVLDERMTWAKGVGFAMVLAGSVWATSSERPAPAPEPTAPGDRADGDRAPGDRVGADVLSADVAACPVPEP